MEMKVDTTFADFKDSHQLNVFPTGLSTTWTLIDFEIVDISFVNLSFIPLNKFIS
jgi:hypothetical protein